MDIPFGVGYNIVGDFIACFDELEKYQNSVVFHTEKLFIIQYFSLPTDTLHEFE